MRTLHSIAVIALVGSAAGFAQPRAPIVPSVDAQIPSPPIPVTVAGKRHLVYELHLTNFRPSDVTLTRVEVLDAVRKGRLGDFRDGDLAARLGRPGAPAALADKRVVAPGMRAVMYFWLPLHDGAATPAKLQHRIELDVVRASQAEHVVVEPGATDVRSAQPVVLEPPLRGGPWVALYDPLMVGGHRTTIYTLDGRARIPARYAIDWVKLADDGTHARGDRSLIANWHGYGADVLAVADAVVAEAFDDLDEAPSLASRPATPVTLENASGNYVSLSLGGGRYAFYEHLQHGSVKVKAGDRVKRGQVIARLGNSGSSSSGPHLHFHVADAQSELAAEGVPFVFRRFDVVGGFDRIDSFTTGERWKPAPAATGGVRTGELPSPQSVIVFRPD